MAEKFNGVIKLDVRDYPGTFSGGTILGVGIDIGKESYPNLEQDAAAALARD